MSDFWSGFIVAAVIFFVPRLTLGQFTIYTRERGFVFRFETTGEAIERDISAWKGK
jgi:hypothetical protein